MTGFDRAELDHVLRKVQDGMVSRRQLRGLGARDHDIARMVRRKELVAVHPGVYVDHTGPLTPIQRRWVAVLVHWPAVLTCESAFPRPPTSGPVHVAIRHHRTVRRLPGIVVHRTADLDSRANWRASPPRMRLEHAALDAALGADGLDAAFRILAEAIHTRETSAHAIAEALAGRAGVRNRNDYRDLISDLASGACSVLEREYLHAVERAHGLPAGERQPEERTASGRVARDVLYPEQKLIVELDGRAFHDSAVARDRDHERDLDAAAELGRLTIRLTYGQVFRRRCRTAVRIARLLRQRGWTGQPTRCPDCA